MNQEVLTTLLARAGDSDSDVRQAALSALGVLVGREDFPMNQAVLTTLLARAGDSDEDVRQAALSALGVLVGREDFPMNQEVLTTLLARAGDSDDVCSPSGLSRLRRLVGREDFPMNQEVLTTLLARAGDSSYSVSQAALGVLVGREDATKTVLPFLTQALSNKDTTLRQGAINFLKSFPVHKLINYIQETKNSKDLVFFIIYQAIEQSLAIDTIKINHQWWFRLYENSLSNKENKQIGPFSETEKNQIIQQINSNTTKSRTH
jgi:BMFP domain-containing protein YqiC